MSAAGHIDPANKKIALLIALLALVLAFSETLGKAAQTAALSKNIEAANLWSFFQAKSIRLTTLRTAAEILTVQSAGHESDAAKVQIESWKRSVARYESEPETREGRKELAERAKDAEAKRDHEMAAYHQYEVASAAVQIGIVLASATIITGIGALAWLASGLGLVGLIFSVIGFFTPTALHLFS
ncbi:MAG: DUF4337 domain-containing protein [Proteobacteria bacterium]|nr:DUF4337 domain-containing protein [Pseudomonadota bacterium]